MFDTNWTREQEMLNRVSHMLGWQKMALMAFAVKRQLDSYKQYVKETGQHQNDLEILEGALDVVWSWVGDPMPLDIAPNLHDLCLNAAPPTNPDNPHPLEYVAQLSAQSAALLVLGLPHPSMHQLLKVCEWGTDAASILIQNQGNLDRASPYFFNAILQHDLMQWELKQQREQILLLEEARDRQLPRDTIRGLIFGS